MNGEIGKQLITPVQQLRDALTFAEARQSLYYGAGRWLGYPVLTFAGAIRYKMSVLQPDVISFAENLN